MPNPARRPLVGDVAADEGQVDQGRDAQAHMIEPDQDTKPVVGKQAEEQLQAPGAELVRRERQLFSVATPVRTAPSWLYQVGSGAMRRNE